MYAQAGYHLLRRGVEAAHTSLQGVSPEYLAKLQHDADAYESSGPAGQIKPIEMLPIVITGLLFAVLVASVRYTVGDVIASLAMIESPTSTAIIEQPPPYSDEPDAPLEEKPILAVTDVEVTVVQHRPVTGSIRKTIRHLHTNGGFFARWRGFGISVLYHVSHGILTWVLGTALFGYSIPARAISNIFASVLTRRLHMLWTHAMIAKPTSKRWYSRIVPFQRSKAVLLPTFVYAAAQQALFILPAAVFMLFSVNTADAMVDEHGQLDRRNAALVALGIVAVPATALFVALAIMLPAAVTLTRVEAALLPEEEETLVTFDRASVLHDTDLTTRGGARALFVRAWRSFDRAARLRIIKLFVKMVLIQFMLTLIGAQVAVAELYIIGGERLAVLLKSGFAQLQLMQLEN